MRSFSIAVAAACLLPAASVGQDVEMLGDRYGTRPPAGYFVERGADEGAFEFSRGRAVSLMQGFQAEVLGGGVPRVLGPRNGPVTGTVRIPVVMGLFADSPIPDSMRYSSADVQPAYFGSAPGTISAFYDEVSGGRVDLVGDVMNWTRASFTRAQATGGESGLVRGTTGPFITQLLARLDSIDWGEYDNDGPDGVPNSGDDDGFVDVLAVLQPTPGGECGGSESDDRIWSHRWSLRSAAGSSFVTTVPSQASAGGFIRIDDYTVQPIFACNGSDLSEIGVFTHELGHAFGLPDLYDTRESIDGKHAGAGNWDLMSSGSWGCDGGSPQSPCHMGAWSKVALGWADVVTLSPDTDHGTVTIPPVETSGTVYRIDATDGSGEYVLLENRQRLGYDQNLMAEGLLIWQIDPDWIAARWGANSVNAYAHRGVWLRQADGRDQLGLPNSGRGDPGDPFPFVQGGLENRAFHAASAPSARSQAGTPAGWTLTDIARSGDDVTAALTTRKTRLTMRASGDTGGGAIFTVDGTEVPGSLHTVVSVPFVDHEVSAAEGDEITPGVRMPFLGWADDASAPSTRVVTTPLVDTELVAEYGGRQVELAIEVAGGVSGVTPGTFTTQPSGPDLWFADGTTVQVQAVATPGFGFVEWSGALAGQPNPATITLAGPVQAGAAFEQTFAVAEVSLSFPAAAPQDLSLTVTEGTAPTFWLRTGGDLPSGMALGLDGRLTGSALETGSFTIAVRATDGLGLQAEGSVTIQVGAPVIDVVRLTQRFLGVGDPLTEPERNFLDRHGNGNGTYDLGDLRRWVLANPALPFSASVRGLVGIVGPEDGR